MNTNNVSRLYNVKCSNKHCSVAWQLTKIFHQWSLVVLVVLVVLLSALTACNDGGDPDDEGGVVGTGIILRGTTSELRTLAANTVEIKALSGEVSSARIGADGRYQSDLVQGTGPWVLRTDLGNGNYRYGIAHDDSINNIHSYSDVILRNWFALSDTDIDNAFIQPGPFDELPTSVEIASTAELLFGFVELVLDSYDRTGQELLSGDFSADNTGIDEYLDKNPVLLEGQVISLLLTEPVTGTQSILNSNLQINNRLNEIDRVPPEAPGSVRAQSSGTDQIRIGWRVAADNVVVTGYEVYRDGLLVATTPYPVFIDTDLEVGATYSYQIVSLDGANNASAPSVEVTGSTLSMPDTVPPRAPTNLTVLAITTNRVDMIWGQTSTGDVAAYTVYRGIGDQPLQPLIQVTTTFVADITVSDNETYCYQVAAEDASGNESLRSDILCVETGGATTPQPPGSATGVPELAGLTLPDIGNGACGLSLSSSAITENTTLSEPCYTVPQNLVIPPFTNLTISAGTILKFAAGTKLLIEQGASLTAVGTPQLPVVLTGVESIPGYWGGVEFNRSNNYENLIRNTLIEFAGGADVEAAIVVRSSVGAQTRLRVENSLLRHSSRFGISFGGLGTIIDSFSGNVVTQNNRPAALNLLTLSSIDGVNDLSGNVEQIIDVPRLPIDRTVVIPDLRVPLRTNGITLSSDARLVINAGVEMRFLRGSILEIDGELDVRGTSDNPVLLTAWVPSPGQWRGLFFGEDATGKLAHTVIEFAGESDDLRATGANLYLRNATVSLSDVTVQGSSSYGFYAEGDAAGYSEFTRVTSTQNEQTGFMHLSSLHTLSASASLAGNDIDRLDVGGVEVSGVNATWYDIGVPYRFDGTYQISDGSVTIAAGVDIVAGSATQLFIEQDAYLTAAGSESAPITFYGDLAVPGHWGGLVFRSDNPANSLNHVVIENAGAITNANPDQNNSGAVRLECAADSPASLGISNTDIISSGSWGIYVDAFGCSLDVGENVGFVNNVLGDINIQ